MSEIYILTCGSMSPSGRVLRRALRNIAKERKIKQIPFTPIVAGYKQFEELLRRVNEKELLVIDGCDNSCSFQFLNSLNVKPKMNMSLDKYAHVTEENVKRVEDWIKGVISEMGSA